jgi:hypothetical protein
MASDDEARKFICSHHRGGGVRGMFGKGPKLAYLDLINASTEAEKQALFKALKPELRNSIEKMPFECVFKQQNASLRGGRSTSNKAESK